MSFLALLAVSLAFGPLAALGAEPIPLGRAPASVAQSPPAGGSREMSETLNITGQSRNLSMGMLFQKEKNKLTFGTPRTDYRDKIKRRGLSF